MSMLPVNMDVRNLFVIQKFYDVVKERYHRLNLLPGTFHSFKILSDIILLPADKRLLQNPPYQIHDHRQHHAEQNHGGNGKIKPGVFPLNADVAGQAADPMQLVAEIINKDTYYNNDGAKNNDVFTCLLVHPAVR